eukprot:Gb_35045 [translate_table: standard]
MDKLKVVHRSSEASLDEEATLAVSVEGLVEYVEETLKLEHEHSPMRPIYLVGDSFGGCLALAIAACNPEMDLVLILSNPVLKWALIREYYLLATSLNKSQWQPFLPLLESMPIEFHSIVPYLLSFVTGDPVRMAMANIDDKLPALERTKKLSDNLADLWPRISRMVTTMNSLASSQYI